MDITVTLNLWFVVALCLAFLVIGMVLNRPSGQSRERY
jgi:hypothetical protein